MGFFLRFGRLQALCRDSEAKVGMGFASHVFAFKALGHESKK
jgi:hypothetical protein